MTLIRIGKNTNGIFHLDLEKKRILKIEVFNKDSLETNFPGSTEEGYTYLKLEKLMKYYMDYDGQDISLESMLEEIKEKGFFFSLKPSLNIFVE